MRVTLALIVAFGVIGSVLVYALSEAILRHDYVVPDDNLALSVRPDASLRARGARIASVVAQCHFCHGPDLAGVVVIDDPWLGRLYTANLTTGSGGIGTAYSDADWVRAIRFGVGPNGQSLLLKPSVHLSAMSDADLAAVISYLRTIPAVSRQLPSTRIGPIIRVGLSLGLTPDLLSAPAVDRSRVARSTIAIAPTAEYGGYLVDIGNCRLCHGSDLRGGLHPLAQPGEPVPPDVCGSGPMSTWSRDDFARAMREGITPGNRKLSTDYMPWPAYAGLTDLEVEALWSYLTAL